MIGRTNAGGGGGSLKATDALLRVQAPAGSTVTITKGTTTKTDLGHENADDHTVYDYYFIIHQSQFDSINPWTVTATLGTDTQTDTIIINAADEYDIEIKYYLYIIRNGYWVNGFSKAVNMRSGYNTSATENYTEGYMRILADQKYTQGLAPQKIDTTRYSTIHFEGYVGANLAQYSGNGMIGAWSSYNYGSASYISSGLASATLSGTSLSVLNIDITNVNAEAYIALNFNNLGSGSSSLEYDIFCKDLYLIP